MPTDATNTTLPRRVLGRRLRELREKRKMSRAHVAAECEMGTQTLWRLESGRSSEVKKMVVNALCDLYEASDDDRRALLWLAQESRKDGWWQSYPEAMVPDVAVFVGLEQAASHETAWQRTLLPGLLQTPDYRRALWSISKTTGQHIDREGEIEVLTKRQERLHHTETFRLTAILDEAVLRHRIGERRTMDEQLIRLLEVSELPNVSIRVVEFNAANHVGLITRDFVYLEFPTQPNPALTEPPVVYIEGFIGDLYLDKPQEVARYQAACATIQQVALDEDDTRRLIEAVSKER